MAKGYSNVDLVNHHTGWDRTRWASLADHLLAAMRRYSSPGHARITPPGAEGGYGHAIDGLEGFARTFLLAGFRLKGENGADPHGYAQWYADGIAAGTDPHSPERWVRMDEHGQAKVEAASTALILDMTRPWIWDRLSPLVQEQVVDYFSTVVGDTEYPVNNWCWFRLVVQTFLRSVGGPHSLDDMQADLDLHDSFVRANGWMADGHARNYDHYAGWALHLYPTLWAAMEGAEDLAAPRRENDKKLLDLFLQDAVHLVGTDGSPLIQGRSLTYRFAAAAPFWVGAMAGVPSTSAGLLRRAASGIVGHFADNGSPDEDGLLTMGWHHEWRQIAQSYSGPSSPYWASKGMLGLALPADHPAWTTPEEPLPVEQGDTLLTMESPGWIVSGTRADGVVRVVNHGTDHANEGDVVADSPLYARYAYSTATSPLQDDAAWLNPATADAAVTLVDAAGRGTHRTGWEALGAQLEDAEHPVGVGRSRGVAHWLDIAPSAHRHGSGWTGEATEAGTITSVSIVRGPWEVRCVRVDRLADGVAPQDVTLRISGWPVVPGDQLTSVVLPAVGGGVVGLANREDASPMGPVAQVPHLDLRVEPGAWTAALVTLTGSAEQAVPAKVAIRDDLASPGAASATITWPDDVVTTTVLA